MRIRRIEIENFGHFHRFTLDGLGSGVQWIRRGNEFGKTTLLEFVRRMFDGFPDRRSSLNLYPALHSEGEYGGRLVVELDSGELLTVERFGLVKGGALRLLRTDGTEIPEPEAALARLLGVGGEFYRNVYAITVDELLSLTSLDSEEIRNRLYGAGMALGGLSLSKLGAYLEKQAAALCRLKGKKNQVAQLAEALQEAEAAVIAAKEALPAYEAARRRENAARQQEEACRRRLAGAEAEAARYEQLLAGAGTFSAFRAESRELAALPPLPAELPPDPMAEFQRLRQAADGAARERKFLDDQLMMVAEKAADTAEAENPLLAHAAAIRSLESQLPALRQTEAELLRDRELLQVAERRLEELGDELSDLIEPGSDAELDASSVERMHALIRRQEQLRAALDRMEPGSSPTERIRWGILLVFLAAVFGAFLWSYWLLAVAALLLTAALGFWRFLPDPRREQRAEQSALYRDLAAFQQEFHLTESCGIELLEGVFSRLEERRRLSKEAAERHAAVIRADRRLTDFRYDFAKLPGASGDPVISLTAMRQVLERAEAALQRRQVLEEQRTVLLPRRARAAEAEAQARSVLAEYLARCGVADEAGLALLGAELLRRRQLAESVQRRGEALRLLFGGQVPKTELAALDSVDTEAERAGLQNRIAGLRSEVSAAATAAGAAAADAQALLGSGEPAELANRAEALRGELKAAAREFLVWSEARRLLDCAIRRYERERQPEVIQRAEKLFCGFTAGRYTRLYQSVAGGELLLVDSLTGTEKRIDALSRGTLGELMIAMRLALIESHEAHGGEHLPLIFDDICVDFDQPRRKAVLSTLETFAAERQLLLFSAN